MVIFEKKKVDILIRLYRQKKYPGIKNLSKGIYSCDTSCLRVLEEFREAGLLTEERKGRSTIRTLTDKGRKISAMTIDILKTLD